MSTIDDNTNDRFTDKLAARALGVLDPAEDAALEAHLTSCADCSSELYALQNTASALAWSLDETRVPRGHRARFLQKLSETSRAIGRRLNIAGTVNLVATEAQDSTALPSAHLRPANGWHGVLGGPTERPVARWIITGSIALALVMLFLLLGTVQMRAEASAQVTRISATATAQVQLSQAQTADLLAQRDKLAAIVNSPSTVSLQFAGAGNVSNSDVQLWVDLESGQGVLVAESLPQAEAGYYYELWFIQDARPQPVDIFSASASGPSLLFFTVSTTTLYSYTAAITVEQRRETVPSGDILLQGQF